MKGHIVQKKWLTDRLGWGKDVSTARRVVAGIATFGFVRVAGSGAGAAEIPIRLQERRSHDHQVANHHAGEGIGDRKSVWSGKSGSVRVDRGGRRISKKKDRATHMTG